MNFHFWATLFLGIFVFLFGLFAVTNLRVTWGEPIMGIAALIAGVLLLLDAFSTMRGT